jgi:hypothetical protein
MIMGYFHVPFVLFSLIPIHFLDFQAVTFSMHFLSVHPSQVLGPCFPPTFHCPNNTRCPITVVARSKAWTAFACSNTGIMGSYPTRSMDVCVRLFCVCVVLCVGKGLATGWSPVQGFLPTVYRIKKLKKRPGSKGLYSKREREIENTR